MTQWGLDTLFNPAKRHMDEEKRRLQSTREEIGDSSGGKRIDLESGKVTISRGQPKDDPDADADADAEAAAQADPAADADAETHPDPAADRAVDPDAEAEAETAEPVGSAAPESRADPVAAQGATDPDARDAG